MESVLKAKNIVKIYGDHKVLDDFNMNISKGDIYGFIEKTGPAIIANVFIPMFMPMILLSLMEKLNLIYLAIGFQK